MIVTAVIKRVNRDSLLEVEMKDMLLTRWLVTISMLGINAMFLIVCVFCCLMFNLTC